MENRSSRVLRAGHFCNDRFVLVAPVPGPRNPDRALPAFPRRGRCAAPMGLERAVDVNHSNHRIGGRCHITLSNIWIIPLARPLRIQSQEWFTIRVGSKRTK
jgi:hypothetical protein